jgi:hypothetical protein
MDETTRDPANRQKPGTPRWVKAFGIVLMIAIVLAVAVILVGGGQHGPGIHAGADDLGGHGPGSAAIGKAHDYSAPADVHEPSHAFIGG